MRHGNSVSSLLFLPETPFAFLNNNEEEGGKMKKPSYALEVTYYLIFDDSDD